MMLTSVQFISQKERDTTDLLHILTQTVLDIYRYIFVGRNKARLYTNKCI